MQRDFLALYDDRVTRVVSALTPAYHIVAAA